MIDILCFDIVRSILYYSTLYDSILYDSILYDSILYDSILYDSTLKDSKMFNRNLGLYDFTLYTVQYDLTSIQHYFIEELGKDDFIRCLYIILFSK